jgi:chemosensory pili system protein ChpC
MSAVFEEIYSLLVPLAGSRLILPRAAVVEVMGYNPPKERPADAPEWLLGWVNWQNNKIPLISFEGACGQPLPEFKSRTRIAVVQAISGLLDPPAFAVATQGYPYLLRVNRGVLRLDDSEEQLPEQLLVRVRMANERPGIPDLESIERMVAQALGIEAPALVAEAVELHAEEPTAIGSGMGATALGVRFDDDDGEALEMPAVADDARIDDDMDLEAVLDDATVEAALDPDPASDAPAAVDEEIVLDDLSTDGLEVDEQ